MWGGGGGDGWMKAAHSVLASAKRPLQAPMAVCVTMHGVHRNGVHSNPWFPRRGPGTFDVCADVESVGTTWRC